MQRNLAGPFIEQLSCAFGISVSWSSLGSYVEFLAVLKWRCHFVSSCWFANGLVRVSSARGRRDDALMSVVMMIGYAFRCLSAPVPVCMIY